MVLLVSLGSGLRAFRFRVWRFFCLEGLRASKLRRGILGIWGFGFRVLGFGGFWA